MTTEQVLFPSLWEDSCEGGAGSSGKAVAMCSTKGRIYMNSAFRCVQCLPYVAISVALFIGGNESGHHSYSYNNHDPTHASIVNTDLFPRNSTSYNLILIFRTDVWFITYWMYMSSYMDLCVHMHIIYFVLYIYGRECLFSIHYILTMT
jgi:hypothetical protein